MWHFIMPIIPHWPRRWKMSTFNEIRWFGVNYFRLSDTQDQIFIFRVVFWWCTETGCTFPAQRLIHMFWTQFREGYKSVMFFFFSWGRCASSATRAEFKRSRGGRLCGGNQSRKSIRPESFMKAEVFRSQLCRQKEQPAAYMRKQRAVEGLNLSLIYLSPR